MFWFIYIILLIICIISEYIQSKNKTNNKIRFTFFIIIFIYHFISIQGYYNSNEIIMTDSFSYLIGFFFPGIIITIIEIWALLKSFNKKD